MDLNTTHKKSMNFCLVGPAGSGKTSLAKGLIDRFPEKIKKSISATTRKPREGEIDGVHYYFLSEEEFKRKKEAGEFFESEIVHGFHYGTPNDTFQKAQEGGYDLIFDIDIRGALTIFASSPENTVITFILTPTLESLTDRMQSRGKISPEEMERRLKTAISEFDILQQHLGKEVRYFIINSDYDKSLEKIKSIYRAENAKFHRWDKKILSQFFLTPKD